MGNNQGMANLLLPAITMTPADISMRYPPRLLKDGARVTRFAPSPTGKLHVGGVYASLVIERLAHQSGGVCYLRLEDTDKKRELAGCIPDILDLLGYFHLQFNEGPAPDGTEHGKYGPYKQSERADIYQAFVKHLIERDLAYPCFCTATELTRIREKQKELGITPGYAGEWAAHRNITIEQAREEIRQGKPYVIRLKSPGSPVRKIVFHDVIKGRIEIPENIQDIVLLKSDGLPTYHFAHAVDDHLMGTTHVLRGDEWLSSTPVHLQLFDVLGFDRPTYGHISPIMKMDGSSRRKFSKRKDLDGLAEYYRQAGYPGQAVVEYFMSLINSTFEDWRRDHPMAPYTDFPVEIGKMSVSGALLDRDKMNDTSKEVISRLSAGDVYKYAKLWAEQYDPEFAVLMGKDEHYTRAILNIGRGGPKPRKDLITWSDIRKSYFYFYDELFDAAAAEEAVLPEKISRETAKQILAEYQQVFRFTDDAASWFNRLKELAADFGFAADMKQYRKHPELYPGSVADIAMLIRIALTRQANTPDLYTIIQVMGLERTLRRLAQFTAKL